MEKEEKIKWYRVGVKPVVMTIAATNEEEAKKKFLQRSKEDMLWVEVIEGVRMMPMPDKHGLGHQFGSQIVNEVRTSLPCGKKGGGSDE